jgi:hypothetical protein
MDRWPTLEPPREIEVIVEEEKCELEEMKDKAAKAIESARRDIEDARRVEALRCAPELLQHANEVFAELEGVFNSAEYGKAIELAFKIGEFIQQAKRKSLMTEEAMFEEVKKSPEEGRYVYCIIPWDGSGHRLSFGDIGMEGGGEVHVVPCRNIAAVVSNSLFKEYVLTEDNVNTHNQVIMLVMEEYPVLPMAFNMIFQSEKVLQRVLQSVGDDLRRVLTDVGGKVEFGVKVINPKGIGFDEDTFASEIKSLRGMTIQCKLGKRFSMHLILNVFYLVEKEKVKVFLGAVKSLQEKFKQLRIQCTGPWPPFNFVTVKVGSA